MASDLWRRARARGGAARRGAVGRAPSRRTGAPPRVLHGVIDLAFRSNDGWELIDYKTDQDGTAALAIRYREQLRQYAAQWARLVGARVTFAGIYAVRNQELSGNLV